MFSRSVSYIQDPRHTLSKNRDGKAGILRQTRTSQAIISSIIRPLETEFICENQIPAGATEAAPTGLFLATKSVAFY